MTARNVILTPDALTNALAGEPICDTCRGRGRIIARRRRDDSVCPTCGGKGITGHQHQPAYLNGRRIPTPDPRGW